MSPMSPRTIALKTSWLNLSADSSGFDYWVFNLFFGAWEVKREILYP